MARKQNGDTKRAMPPYLGQRLRALRVERGLSGTDAATVVGVKPNHLYCVERGEKMLSLDAVRKAAEFYGVDIGWLLEPSKRRK